MKKDPQISKASKALFNAPELRPTIRLRWYQWIGIPAILMVPVMAVMGVLDNQSGMVDLRHQMIETTIE